MNTTLAVIGCGGTGSYLLPLLFRSIKLETTNVLLFDGDSFTEANLDRQLFRPDFVGMNKALAMKAMHGNHKSVATHGFLKDPDELAKCDLVIACPDNHLARNRVLVAADRHEFPAIICGNEYESASAMYYDPEWKGSPLDPRVRYPDITTDLSGSPVDVSCTGKAQESAPQLALANNTSAVFAMQLMYFWLIHMGPELLADKEAYGFFPVELNWALSRVATSTVDSVIAEYEALQAMQNEQGETDGNEET